MAGCASNNVAAENQELIVPEMEKNLVKATDANPLVRTNINGIYVMHPYENFKSIIENNTGYEMVICDEKTGEELYTVENVVHDWQGMSGWGGMVVPDDYAFITSDCVEYIVKANRFTCKKNVKNNLPETNKNTIAGSESETVLLSEEDEEAFNKMMEKMEEFKKIYEIVEDKNNYIYFYTGKYDSEKLFEESIEKINQEYEITETEKSYYNSIPSCAGKLDEYLSAFISENPQYYHKKVYIVWLTEGSHAGWNLNPGIFHLITGDSFVGGNQGECGTSHISDYLFRTTDYEFLYSGNGSEK